MRTVIRIFHAYSLLFAASIHQVQKPAAFAMPWLQSFQVIPSHFFHPGPWERIPKSPRKDWPPFVFPQSPSWVVFFVALAQIPASYSGSNRLRCKGRQGGMWGHLVTWYCHLVEIDAFAAQPCKASGKHVRLRSGTFGNAKPGIHFIAIATPPKKRRITIFNSQHEHFRQTSVKPVHVFQVCFICFGMRHMPKAIATVSSILHNCVSRCFCCENKM